MFAYSSDFVLFTRLLICELSGCYCPKLVAKACIQASCSLVLGHQITASPLRPVTSQTATTEAMKANQHRLVRSIPYITTITMANILASCATPPPIAPVPQPMFTVVSIPQAKPRQEILPAPRIRVVKASWYGHAFAGHKTTSG